MAKITVETEANSVKTARDLVVEPATGADTGAIAPARAIQYNGALLSPGNKLPVDVKFPETQVSGSTATSAKSPMLPVCGGIMVKAGTFIGQTQTMIQEHPNLSQVKLCIMANSVA